MDFVAFNNNVILCFLHVVPLYIVFLFFFLLLLFVLSVSFHLILSGIICKIGLASCDLLWIDNKQRPTNWMRARGGLCTVLLAESRNYAKRESFDIFNFVLSDLVGLCGMLRF